MESDSPFCPTGVLFRGDRIMTLTRILTKNMVKTIASNFKNVMILKNNKKIVSTTKKYRKIRFIGLEGYRGIAALFIVIYHAYQNSHLVTIYAYQYFLINILLRNLQTCVDWFFVLSGFLITFPFIRAAMEQRRPLSVRGFLIRRIIRILPVYYIAIILVWTLRFTGEPVQWLDLLEHLTFIHIFDKIHIFWTIGPAWSLADEVFFYLIFAGVGPLFYTLCSRFYARTARAALLFGGVTALMGISVIFKWWAFFVIRIPQDNYKIYFGPLSMFDTFAIGMLLAIFVAAVENRPILTALSSFLMRLAGIGILITTFILHFRYSFVGVYFNTLSGIAFVLVLASTVLGVRHSLWERVLTSFPIRYLGMISYSLYIWHEPIMIALTNRHLLTFANPATFIYNMLAFLAISILVAIISYWAIEYPAMHIRHLFSHEGRLLNRYKQLLIAPAK